MTVRHPMAYGLEALEELSHGDLVFFRGLPGSQQRNEPVECRVVNVTLSGKVELQRADSASSSLGGLVSIPLSEFLFMLGLDIYAFSRYGDRDDPFEDEG